MLTVVAIAQRGVVNRGATDMKILLLLAIIATIVMLFHMSAVPQPKADRPAA